MEIQYWVKVLPFLITFKHVRGHQDKNTNINNLSPIAQMNVKMDSHAKKLFTTPSDTPTRTTISPFLINSCVSFSTMYTRISNNYYSNFLHQYLGSKAEVQLQKTFRISDNDLKKIDWDNIKMFFRNKRGYEKYKLIKTVHRQWPVMKRNHEWGEITSPTCLLCGKESETCDHVLRCSSQKTQSCIRSGLQTFHANLVELQTLPLLRKHIMRILRQWFTSYSVPKINIKHVRESEIEVAEAINDQISIGVDNFVRGIFAWKIGKVQQTFYETIEKKLNGNGKMWVRKVMDLMIHLTHEVWKNRCEHVNTTLNMSYESRLRNKCMTLWIDLQSKKKDVPLLYRHLLNKEQCFFKNATVSALKSWIRRIQLAIKTLEESRYTKMDCIC